MKAAAYFQSPAGLRVEPTLAVVARGGGQFS
jgi:hypothetical protein